MGIQYDDFGDNDIIIKTIPVIFGKIPREELILDIIETIMHEQNKTKELIEYRIIRNACRKSIKAGELITSKEIEILYQKLKDCENPFTCPHGRPTLIRLTYDELEKKFKRK